LTSTVGKVFQSYKPTFSYKVTFFNSIQINHQPDATSFQFIILTLIYSSTGFGRFPTHYQELNDCSGSPLVLPSYRGDSRAVFVVNSRSQLG
jgi:hypothetical protein